MGTPPTKYRKKPVEIEAMYYTGSEESANEIIQWMQSHGEYASLGNTGVDGVKVVAIHTLEGVMAASPGDMVVRGVEDEFYPCKPSVFEQTYEAVPERPWLPNVENRALLYREFDLGGPDLVEIRPSDNPPGTFLVVYQGSEVMKGIEVSGALYGVYFHGGQSEEASVVTGDDLRNGREGVIFLTRSEAWAALEKFLPGGSLTVR